MKRTVILLSTLWVGMAHASLFPNQSEYYYRLGGASDLYVPPVTKTEHITIGVDANADDVLNCTRFNPVISIANSFNGLKNKISGVPSTLVDGLKGSVAGFPMYKLQQSMPALYNVLQNTSFSAQNEFAMKVSDCYQVKRNLEEGNSPVASMLSVSDSQGWIETAARAGKENKNDQVDIVESSKTIAKNSETYGIPWVHGKKGNSGGINQTPVKVISDVVIAGYNLLLPTSRALDNTSIVGQEIQKNTPYTQVWSSPKAASDWAVLVLGDIQLSYDKKAGFKDAKAGVGLTTLLQSCPHIANSKTCVANVADLLWKLVNREAAASEQTLRNISAGNIFITKDIITTISQMPKDAQIITVSRLSEEIAIQNLLDEAMMMRRILLAGFQIHEVQNLKPAQMMIRQALKRLDDDIQSLAFESEIRKKMMTDTLRLLMEIRSKNLANSQPNTERSIEVIKHGAVYTGTQSGEK